MLDEIINCNSLEWQDAESSFSEGTKIKVLRDDKDGRTVILRLPKGFRMEGHSHIRDEQHFILKGQYEMNDKVFSQGTYQLIHKDMTHGPYTSETGAEIMVIWHF